MRRFYIILLIAAMLGIVFTATLPGSRAESATYSGTAEEWFGLSGSFVRADSSQLSSAVLNLKNLDESFALFEFRLMERSESEESVFEYAIAGVLLINEDGGGVYETINFTLSLADGAYQVEVTQNGDFVISPGGHYDFVDEYLEVSDLGAAAILEHLPTAATSLNSNNGAYTINVFDASAFNWFYLVEAVFDDSGVVLAKFLVAKDLSSVFRVDDDIEPIIIYGFAGLDDQLQTGPIVLDFSYGNPEPYWIWSTHYSCQDISAEELVNSLSWSSGLDFYVAITGREDGGINVDWATDSSLIIGEPPEDNEERLAGLPSRLGDYLHFYDADSLRWFMMDSLYHTLRENGIGGEEIYYTMNGGQELVFEELYPFRVFPLDVPYLGSAFYFAHCDLRGDD